MNEDLVEERPAEDVGESPEETKKLALSKERLWQYRFYESERRAADLDQKLAKLTFEDLLRQLDPEGKLMSQQGVLMGKTKHRNDMEKAFRVFLDILQDEFGIEDISEWAFDDVSGELIPPPPKN